jgi:Na+-transporting NADH:ubiquinone oxidoreductase subunit NqrB
MELISAPESIGAVPAPGPACPTPALTKKPAGKGPLTLVLPSLKDPRVTMAFALTLWTVLGQEVYYFNRNPLQLGLALGIACTLDVILGAVLYRQIALPLSAYLTALSIGLLIESNDLRIFIAAPIWGVLSKYLITYRKQHFFNPSNFAIVATLLLSHGLATVTPGSQWGADYRVSVAILCIGMMMMVRVKRWELAVAWVTGYVFMAFVRMALGQGGVVFALGPMTGAEFALFTFSMLPDPKASPSTRRGRIWWGLSIAIMDGIMRYYEIRFSMFYALFAHTAILPIMRWAASRKPAEEKEPWRLLRIPLKPAAAEPA